MERRSFVSKSAIAAAAAGTSSLFGLSCSRQAEINSTQTESTEFLSSNHNLQKDSIKSFLVPDSFNLKGDGINDDTDALQQLFNDARGGSIFFPNPSNVYLVSRLVVPERTRIIGQLKLLTDRAVRGNAAVLKLEKQVVADTLCLEISKSSMLQRCIVLSERCQVAQLSVSSTVQVARGNDILDGMIQLRGDNIKVGQIICRGCDKAVVAFNCKNLTIDKIRIESYSRGLFLRNVENFTVNALTCTGLSPNSEHKPGHNGILLSSVKNAIFNGVIIEDSGEHGIRIGGPDTFQSEHISFVGPIIRKSGQCGFKAHPGTGNTVTGLSLISPMIVDSASRSKPGTNEDGIRLEEVRDAQIIGATITKQNNNVSGYDGIYLNDCSGIVIDSPRIFGVANHGINIEPHTGSVNSIFINCASIMNCRKSGVRLQRLDILSDIILTRTYIRDCSEYGVHCSAEGNNSGDRQPVIIDGWIKDSALGGKLIPQGLNLVDDLLVL
ncbi:MAG: hypothetical protein AB4040_03885 [Synechococcus sp.]